MCGGYAPLSHFPDGESDLTSDLPLRRELGLEHRSNSLPNSDKEMEIATEAFCLSHSSSSEHPCTREGGPQVHTALFPAIFYFRGLRPGPWPLCHKTKLSHVIKQAKCGQHRHSEQFWRGGNHTSPQPHQSQAEASRLQDTPLEARQRGGHPGGQRNPNVP